MSKRTGPLLLVAYSARSLLASAWRSGLQVEAIDFFADADSKEMASVHQVTGWAQVPAIAASIRPQAILFGGGFETQPEVVAALRQIAPLLNVSATSCEACRDPSVWPAIVRGTGCDTPAVVVPGVDATAASTPTDWLIKNRWTAGGVGVRLLEKVIQGEEPQAIFSRGDYLQQRLSGKPCSALFWLGSDCCCSLGFFRQLSGEPQFGAKAFAYSGAIGPLPIDLERRAWLKQLAYCLANEFGLRGIVGVDLIEFDASLSVIEINPRMTATAELWERANPEFSLVDFLIRGTLAGWSEPQPLEQSAAGLQGKAILYWSEQVPLAIDQLVSEVLRDWRRQGKVADLPVLNSSVPPGAPVVTLFAKGATEAEVLVELKQSAGQLRQSLSAAAVRSAQ